jgi:hypothetical protein
MVASPSYQMTIQDRGLGPILGTGQERILLVGPSIAGPVNSLAEPTDPNVLRDDYEGGILVEAGAYLLEIGIQVLLCRVSTEEVGTVGDVTKAPESGGATLDVSASEPIDDFDVAVKVTKGGAVGTATIQISLDGGVSYSKSVLTSDAYIVPGSLFKGRPDPGIVLDFTGTLQLNDVYTFEALGPRPTNAEYEACFDEVLENEKLWGTAAVLATDRTLGLTSVSRFGGSAPAVTASGTPASDDLDFRVEITTGGAVATAVFRWSKDGGATWTTAVTTAASVVLTGTGVTLAFPAGTYATDHVYTFRATYSALRALITSLGSKMTAEEQKPRYSRIHLESYSRADDGALEATVDGLVQNRVCLWGGGCRFQSASTELLQPRSALLPGIDIIMDRDLSIDAATGVGSRPLRRVDSLFRDERKTPRLNAARISCLRTWFGYEGQAYVNNALLLAEPGSDYELQQYGRIMDLACTTVYQRMMKYSSAKLRTDKKTGKILERDARSIESWANAGLEENLVNSEPEQRASAAWVEVFRNDNILATKKLRWVTRLVGPAYGKELDGVIGYINPAAMSAAQTETT